MFTTSILNQRLRNQPIAWRPLGYLYDLSLIISESEAKKMSNDLKYSRLHAMFRCILETFVDVQKEGALSNIELMLGRQKKTVNLKISCFLSLVICKVATKFAVACQHIQTKSTGPATNVT